MAWVYGGSGCPSTGGHLAGTQQTFASSWTLLKKKFRLHLFVKIMSRSSPHPAPNALPKAGATASSKALFYPWCSHFKTTMNMHFLLLPPFMVTLTKGTKLNNTQTTHKMPNLTHNLKTATKTHQIRSDQLLSRVRLFATP